MSGLLGTRAPIEIELNLLLQIIILTIILVGYRFARNKTQSSLRMHERIMTIVVALNSISILLVMGPIFVMNFDVVLSEAYAIGFPITLVHHSFGLVAEILGVILVVRKFGNVRRLMKLTFLIWLIALTLGIFIFMRYYVI